MTHAYLICLHGNNGAQCKDKWMDIFHVKVVSCNCIRNWVICQFLVERNVNIQLDILTQHVEREWQSLEVQGNIVQITWWPPCFEGFSPCLLVFFLPLQLTFQILIWLEDTEQRAPPSGNAAPIKFICSLIYSDFVLIAVRLIILG